MTPEEKKQEVATELIRLMSEVMHINTLEIDAMRNVIGIAFTEGALFQINRSLDARKEVSND
jgi:hypothetical protein